MHPRACAAVRGRGLAATAATALLLAVAGCGTSPVPDDEAALGTTSTAAPATAAPEERLTGDALAEAVEERYLIGPAAARELGYRVDWQYPSSGSPIQQVVVADDAVFTLDARNFLTRLRREEGDRIWRIPIANAVDRIFGITFAPSLERLYVTAGGELFVLDAASGSRLSKQKLQYIANTAPVEYGQFLIYGSRDGKIVWHAPVLGTTWRAYQVSRSIQLPPVIDGNLVVAVGNDGRIMSLDVANAAQVWSRKVLDSIVAPPVVGNGAAYVASLDQHVRGYELAVNRSPLWEYLTESPLRHAPVLVDDHVYQQVPSEGLVCLEALPLDSPGGVVVWRAAACGGSVVTAIGRNLIAWNREDGKLDLIDERFGAVVGSKSLPHVDDVTATSPRRGDLYVTSTDGRLERLVPR